MTPEHGRPKPASNVNCNALPTTQHGKAIVARDEQEEPGTRLTCSICESEVDLEGEGGIAGNFGICPVAFCVWCYASIIDMVSQGCLRCQEDDEEPPTIN